MLPKPPPRGPRTGFIYEPPYRIQGESVAGEHTVIQVPELGLNFDMGSCPRWALAAGVTAVSHGHMDHIGALPYYFSQRNFQGMGVGTVVCPPSLVIPLRDMMKSWIALERQRTPFELVGLAPGEEWELKPDVFLRPFETSHTVPSQGYCVVEKRKKLKPEFHGFSQEQLKKLRSEGTQITDIHEHVHVAYTGDTQLCPALMHPNVATANVVITECTFFAADERKRAGAGKHLHVEDLRTLLSTWESDCVVVVHLSRRSNIQLAREELDRIPEGKKVHLLMDNPRNTMRYEQQVHNVESRETES